MRKKITSILILIFFLSSCGDTLDSVKRGLTGAKGNTADEFLVKKKDPLILPPDFESLPLPDEEVTNEEVSVFEKNLETSVESESSGSSSVEESILRKIKSR
tara:strand:+ start:1139 stop:1444 length:306 start_codon:yes stop_codon:yes gene_type:complete